MLEVVRTVKNEGDQILSEVPLSRLRTGYEPLLCGTPWPVVGVYEVLFFAGIGVVPKRLGSVKSPRIRVTLGEKRVFFFM